MLKTHERFIFFLILFFITLFSTLVVTDHQSGSEVFGKYISPSSLGLKREKLSHLHFYFPNVVVGKNATAVRVAEAPTKNRTIPFFGDVYVIDDPLTIEPNVNSKTVGRAQGMYVLSSQTEFSLVMALNFVFTEGQFIGSTLSVLARNKVLSAKREMPIVGGSGVFRFACGYAEATTYFVTPKQIYYGV